MTPHAATSPHPFPSSQVFPSPPATSQRNKNKGNAAVQRSRLGAEQGAGSISSSCLGIFDAGKISLTFTRITRVCNQSRG